MTAFDVFVILVLLVSALVGFSRGAVRELVTVFAFTLATAVAVFSLPLSGRIVRHLVHPAWAGNASALAIVFVLAYVLVRTLGGLVTRRLHESSLGAVDRTIGLGFGVVRALVLLGAFYLVFTKVTPPDLPAGGVRNALTFPVARASGQALASIAPKGMVVASGFGRMMRDGVSRGFSQTDDGDQAPERTLNDTSDAVSEPRRLTVEPAPTYEPASRHRPRRRAEPLVEEDR